MGVVFYNGAYQVATTTSFGNHDEGLKDNDHEGFRLDPDELRHCIYSEFEHNILPKIQRDPKFITAGILGATDSQKKTFYLRVVERAKIYRNQNRKPTDEEIAAAEAERAARDALLAQLEEGKAALLDLKNNHEGKIKQMKSEMKEKEYEITALKGEVDNKQSPGKKMQSKINDKLLATGNVTGAMQWFEKNKEHNIREKKLGLLGAQGISTTGAIAGNAKGDGNHTSESLLATYNQLTLGINATDTVPKEQYDNDIKRLQQKCTDSDNKCTGERAEKLIWESKYNNSDQKNKELKEKLTVVKQECEKWKGDTGKFERALADETAKFEGVKDVLSRVRGMRKDDEDRYQALLEEYLKLKNRSL